MGSFTISLGNNPRLLIGRLAFFNAKRAMERVPKEFKDENYINPCERIYRLGPIARD